MAGPRSSQTTLLLSLWGPPWELARLVIAVACFLSLLAVDRSVTGQDGINREPTIKAAFLAKFGKYVTWPESAFADKSAPLVIGTIGESAVAAPLQEIGKRNLKVQNRPLKVRIAAKPADLAGCHIVYLPATLPVQQRAEVLSSIKGRCVLTVGDDAEFLTDGGLIQFIVRDNRLGGSVSLEAFEREKLKVSSELLNIFRPAN